MSAALEVLEVRRIEGHGNLCGFAKVRLGAVAIHNCRVIRRPGQKAWVALPQQPAGRKRMAPGAAGSRSIEITTASCSTGLVMPPRGVGH